MQKPFVPAVTSPDSETVNDGARISGESTRRTATRRRRGQGRGISAAAAEGTGTTPARTTASRAKNTTWERFPVEMDGERKPGTLLSAHTAPRTNDHDRPRFVNHVTQAPRDEPTTPPDLRTLIREPSRERTPDRQLESSQRSELARREGQLQNAQQQAHQQSTAWQAGQTAAEAAAPAQPPGMPQPPGMETLRDEALQGRAEQPGGAQGMAIEIDADADEAEAPTRPKTYGTFEEDPGMLRLHYAEGTPRERRFKLQPLHVAGGYTALAASIEGVPAVQTDGINPPYPARGSFTLYMPYAAAVNFCNAVTQVEVEVVGDEEQQDGTAILVPRATKVFAATQVSAPMDLPPSFIDEECAWVEIRLDDGPEFTYVHTEDVKIALMEAGCHTYKAARKQISMDTPDGPIKLGPEFRTSLINVTCKPIGKAVKDFAWPAIIEGVTKKAGYSFRLKYRLGGPGTERLHSGKLGCKRPLSDCSCVEPEEQAQGSNAARKRPVQMADDRRAKAAAGQSAFLSRYVPDFAKKGQIPCPHLLRDRKGYCQPGSKCNYMHAGSPEDWANISCGRPRTSSGACDAWPNCIYKGCPKPSSSRAEMRTTPLPLAP